MYAIFQVSVGRYVSETLPTPLRYVDAPTASEIPLVIIIPVIGGGLLVVVIFSMLIICCVVCYHRRKSKKTEQRWTNLLSQMELMELEMADECKRGELVDLSACVCVCVCVRREMEGEEEKEREREQPRCGSETLKTTLDLWKLMCIHLSSFCIHSTISIHLLPPLYIYTM